MFKCESCQRVIGPQVSATRVVIETRPVTYPFREKAHRIKIEGKPKMIDDPGGVGQEIVREILVCPDCAEKLRA
jgi:hypothetical protein